MPIADACFQENPAELRKFVAPEFIFGDGALELVGSYAAKLGARHVLVVTDEGVRAAGWADKVIASLEDAGLHWSIFSDVTPNPRVEEVMAGVERYHRAECDALVAVGGGSPIDCAKGIGIAISNNRYVGDFEGVDQIANSLPPLLCIPTTAGSAADVSQFAILSDRSQGRKIALISKALVPDLSLVDPVCTVTMPPYLTACTAFDALVHAIESYVSTGHGPITDLHALEAIRIIARHLPRVMEQPDHLPGRAQLALASLQAGLAFSNASLGAIHAMAHILGGRLDVAHGECNALLMEHVIAFNFDAAPLRFRCIAEMFGVETVGLDDGQVSRALGESLCALRRSAGITRSLADLGVRKEDIPGYARDALRDACIVTNPKLPTQADIERIYERSL